MATQDPQATGMKFADALDFLQTNEPAFGIRRTDWNSKEVYVCVQRPDVNSKMTQPYLYLVAPPNSTEQFSNGESENRVPWLPSQSDLFSNKWEIKRLS